MIVRQKIRFWDCIVYACMLGVTGLLCATPPFALEESNPSSAYFKKRFLGSYGINEAIEPVLDASDRPLYEKVLPYIEKNPRQAYDLLKREVSKESNAAFDFLLGSLAYQMDQLNESKQWMESAVSKFPTFRRAWLTLALVLVRQDQYQQSIVPLQKVIALGGGDAQSYGLLAYAWLHESKYRSALAAYQQALMFDPNNKDFRRGLAYCLQMTGQYEQAVALFDELIVDYPNDVDIWLHQTNVWLSLQQYQKAIGNLEIVRSLGNPTVDSLYLLGDLYLREDIPQLALQAYTEAVLKSKDLQIGAGVRALNYFVERMYLVEAESLMKLIKPRAEKSQTVELVESLQLAEAVLLQKKEQYEAALAILLPLVKKHPLNGVALLRTAECYLALKNDEQAEFYLERAVLVPEQQIDAWIALGRMEVGRGNMKAALAYLRKVQTMRPNPNIQQLIEQLEKST
jgi:tetratricopeptide (TPR) repeat protein